MPEAECLGISISSGRVHRQCRTSGGLAAGFGFAYPLLVYWNDALRLRFACEPVFLISPASVPRSLSISCFSIYAPPRLEHFESLGPHPSVPTSPAGVSLLRAGLRARSPSPAPRAPLSLVVLLGFILAFRLCTASTAAAQSYVPYTVGDRVCIVFDPILFAALPSIPLTLTAADTKPSLPLVPEKPRVPPQRASFYYTRYER